MNKVYSTLAKDGESRVEEKKSVFLGYARKVTTESEAEEFIAKIRALHRDARHNVYAYILSSGAMKCSDDGEPQGTAGMPLLSAIEKFGVSDTMVVVTRYFGGILLGAPGLLRAYSAAAASALADAGKAVFELFSLTETTLSYTDYNRLLPQINRLPCKIDKSDFGADVSLTVAIRADAEEELCALIREKTAGKSEVRLLSQRYDSL